MPHPEPPSAPPATPPAFDPAAAGWQPYRDEGFIGLVGPFWTLVSGDTHLFAFTAEPKHHNHGCGGFRTGACRRFTSLGFSSGTETTATGRRKQPRSDDARLHDYSIDEHAMPFIHRNLVLGASAPLHHSRSEWGRGRGWGAEVR